MRDRTKPTQEQDKGDVLLGTDIRGMAEPQQNLLLAAYAPGKQRSSKRINPTYEQGEEDVLSALYGEIDWTAVPGAQKAQAEHMHLHDPVCLAVGLGPLRHKTYQRPHFQVAALNFVCLYRLFKPSHTSLTLVSLDFLFMRAGPGATEPPWRPLASFKTSDRAATVGQLLPGQEACAL